jgi:GNAT superfamily N-acetyltransferase
MIAERLCRRPYQWRLLHHDVPDPPAQHGRLPIGDLGHRPVVGRPPDGGQASAAVLRAGRRHQSRGRTRRQAGRFPGRVHLQSRSGEACIHFAGVDPAQRGSGLGRLLYEAFFAAAQARGCVLVRAVTSRTTAARPRSASGRVSRSSPATHRLTGSRFPPAMTATAATGFASSEACVVLDLLLTPQCPGDSCGGPEHPFRCGRNDKSCRKNCRAITADIAW